MDAYAKHLHIARAMRNQTCDLELISTLTLDDGTTQEVLNARRAVCKKVTRKRNVTVLEFTDIDRAALDQVFPFETFTVADFPEVFIDHVGRRVPQIIREAVKVPLTWIVKAGGVWKYAGPKLIGVNTLLAVYRGTQPGQGSVVPAAEYTTGSSIGASTGVVVSTVNFTREQIDFQGRPYIIEADYSSDAVPYPSQEVRRILNLYGIATDTASFDAAFFADSSPGFFVDCLYGGDVNGRTGKAIIEDLLRVARGWLSITATGAWAIVQDVAKASTLQFDSAADLIDIDEYGDGEIAKTVSIAYRPRASNQEDYTGKLSRTTVGQAGEMVLKNPYIRDHTVADKLLSYWQKRLNSLRIAKASLHAVQIANGDVINLTDYTNWTGAKDFIGTGITRPGDKNDVVLREYDASIYTYTPGTLPADATNTYTPDYSFTAPLAPSGLSVVSQGTGIDADGKVTAFALIRVTTPPAVNWAWLNCVVTDTVTNETYPAKLTLNAGNYEVMVSGMHCNHTSNVVAQAVNATNQFGAFTAAVNFTSATNTAAPGTPGSVAVTQYAVRQLRVTWAAVAGAHIRRYIVFKKIGAGSFDAGRTVDALYWIDENISYGTNYGYKIQSEDNVGNVSADSSTVTNTPVGNLADADITPTGVNGPSIGNGSINRGRGYTGTGSASGTLGAGAAVYLALDEYVYFPSVTNNQSFPTGDIDIVAYITTIVIATSRFGLVNNGTGNQTYDVEWRSVTA